MGNEIDYIIKCLFDAEYNLKSLKTINIEEERQDAFKISVENIQALVNEIEDIIAYWQEEVL